MKKTDRKVEILAPKNQLNLYGYEKYFNFFIKLFNNKKMPNRILLSGQKGLGKSTFIYHLVHYILSNNQEGEYSLSDHKINNINKSYNKIISNIHPNFFLLETQLGNDEIKIEQVRSLLEFLNKSTYLNNIKIVLIDNAEYLNLNSSNALLKCIEEAETNTFFFITHDNSYKILDTIKSICIEFKVFFNALDKKNIFKNLTKQYSFDLNINDIDDFFYFDTPGNMIKYTSELLENNIHIKNNNLNCIFYFIEKHLINKNPETLSFIRLFIEKFYNDLYIKNNSLISSYSDNKNKILTQIRNMKKFNLSEKNTYIWMKDILLNEAK